VAIVSLETAKECGLTNGVAVGDHFIFSAKSRAQLRRQIIQNPRLRRALPLVIDVLPE
jgi:hypothetical protein